MAVSSEAPSLYAMPTGGLSTLQMTRTAITRKYPSNKRVKFYELNKFVFFFPSNVDWHAYAISRVAASPPVSRRSMRVGQILTCHDVENASLGVLFFLGYDTIRTTRQNYLSMTTQPTHALFSQIHIVPG